MKTDLADPGTQSLDISRTLRKKFRRVLLGFGSRIPAQAIDYAQTAAACLEIGHWLKAHGSYPELSMPSRDKIFDFIGNQVRHKQVLYLEFGVYEGASIKYWSTLLRNPLARLHGFDSFEGLPEAWTSREPQRHFSTNGRPPEIADKRVTFFKGWFDETLPNYVLPSHEALVINIDADLYSSAKFVLDRLKDSIKIGTWLYFDEFLSWQHEFRAFREFVDSTGMCFEGVAETDCLWSVAFRRRA